MKQHAFEKAEQYLMLTLTLHKIELLEDEIRVVEVKN